MRVVVISQESRRAMPACVRSGAAGRAATHHFLEIGHSDGCCAFDERRRLASGGQGNCARRVPHISSIKSDTDLGSRVRAFCPPRKKLPGSFLHAFPEPTP